MNLQPQPERGDGDSIDRVGLLFLVGFGLATLVGWMFIDEAASIGWQLALTVASTGLISIVIWQACDPFAEAAQWVGIRFRIPGSVRGATLDAIASSMPELFSGVFFVLVAITAAGSLADSQVLLDETTAGFASSIAICAGSSIYNLVLIPAICAIAISYARPAKPQIEFEDEVLKRDGFWVIASQFGLLVILYLPTLYWWLALFAIAGYVFYILHLLRDTRRFRQNQDEFDESELPEGAGLFFGVWQLRFTQTTVIATLVITTLIAAAACYFLVEITNHSAKAMSVPPFFVAVILAAAASSIPDTFMSLGAARRGDDSGAISNVFGSNIFDICIGMSVPLLLCCYLNDWQPISLAGQNEATIRGVAGLRVLLFVLTGTVMYSLWKKRVITKTMGYFYFVLYLVFVGYAIIQAT